MTTQETLLEFPCEFPIKAMGKARDDLDKIVHEIICQFAPETPYSNVKITQSKKGNYLSITTVITATSKEQLDNIYHALTASEHISMAL